MAGGQAKGGKFLAKKKKILPGIIEGSQTFGLGVKFVFFEWMA
jgi:hypothetical protein